MKVAVIVPTIAGREDFLELCLDAYERTAPDATVVVVKDEPTCGIAWAKGADHVGDFDYLHLTADDLEPQDDWLQAAVETVDAGYIPAPLVLLTDGTLQSAGLQGFDVYTGSYADWQLVEGTTVPFVSREMWNKIGMIDTQYCTDLWVSRIGRMRGGWETVIRTPIQFVHHNAMAGRIQHQAPSDTQIYINKVSEAMLA